MEAIRRVRVGWVVVASLLVALSACGGEKKASEPAGPATPAGRFACLGFEAKVTSGPDNGKVYTGDLVLDADATGRFTGVLVPAELVNQETLKISDPSQAKCRALGQRNGLMISWVLQCDGGERVFGTGQFTLTPEGKEEVRGVVNGPQEGDFGVYHGTNRPPFIRIITVPD